MTLDSAQIDRACGVAGHRGSTAQLIEQLRAEGRTVLVHCHGAYSRTPTVGAIYGARVRGVSGQEALADVLEALPDGNPNGGFRSALNRLAP